VLVQETGINDVCQEETGFMQVPIFNKRNSVSPLILGSHFSENQDDYEYTLSTWIKIGTGLETRKTR